MTGHRADGPLLGIRAAGEVAIGYVPVWLVLLLAGVLVVSLIVAAQDRGDW